MTGLELFRIAPEWFLYALIQISVTFATNDSKPEEAPIVSTTVSPETPAVRAIRQTRALILAAERHFKTAMPFSEIRFDLRGKTAGQLRIEPDGSLRIRYNPVILTRQPDAFVAQTVPHEAAHLVAFRLYGTAIKPHGIEWRRIMLFFGARPERCHRYAVEGLATRQIRRYDYHCQCQTHRLTSIRHHRILKGQIYRCRRCGEALQYGTSTAALKL